MRLNYPKLILILRTWLPFAAILTLITGTIYITVQQNFRQNANDPQIQIAENVALVVSRGTDPRLIPDSDVTDIKDSISPYIIMFL